MYYFGVACDLSVFFFKGTSRLISTDNDEDKASGDENKNVTNAPALVTTDELIAVLSGESEAIASPPPEPVKPEKLKIRIIRSYNDSIKEQAAVVAPPQVKSGEEPVPETRTTRRRGKLPEQLRISPLVSEFDNSSLLGSSEDGTSQTSLAAAPPSGSENNSTMETSPIEEQPIVQKTGRERKKVFEASEVVLKPPEPEPVLPPPPRKTRNTRNNPGEFSWFLC